ncbi:uracil-DNA glycosylase family protein [Corynebacterium variabile]
MRLLIVGINPGPWTTAVNAPFARPGNRFWPSLAAAGILPAPSTPRGG